jgi:hypothetical protein
MISALAGPLTGQIDIQIPFGRTPIGEINP